MLSTIRSTGSGIAMNDNSFIKLYRSLLEWEWWDNKNVTRLFLTILLNVNWQDKKWHGITIEKGSMFTSLDHLSEKSGLSIQQTRTALNKLISTGEITSKPTSNGTLVTVENWGKYQFVPTEPTHDSTSRLTNDQQTDNKRTTNDQQQLKNNKNIKNLNNLKNDTTESIKVGEPYKDPVTGRIRFKVG